MFNLDWLKPPAPAQNSESLLQENEILKKQLKELLTLDETGFFIELDSLLKAILKKALILCKAESSFIALTGKDPSDLDVRVSNLILEEKMGKIREKYKKEYARWKETESDILPIDDFILLPLVRRHKMLGVVGLKLNSDAPDNICEILPVLAYKAAASLESAILYDRMFKRLLVLSNVFILGREIIANLDLQTLVDKFLSTAVNGTDSEFACIYLFRDKLEYPYFSRVFSKDNSNVVFSSESVTGYTDLIRLVRNEGKANTINSFENSEFKKGEINKIQGIRIKDTIVIPLNPRDTMLGVIQVCNKKGNSSYSYEDMDLLNILGSQIAFVIQNAELFNNLQKAYLDTLSALTNAIDAKDSYTRGHSDRVTELSVRLGKEAKLENDDLDKIRLGGMLHDIGKIGVPEAIINKTTHLTDEEYGKIKQHTVIGSEILDLVAEFPELTIGARSHHERYDGKGYPDHLEIGRAHV